MQRGQIEAGLRKIKSDTYSGRCQSAVFSHQDVWICCGNKTCQSKQRKVRSSATSPNKTSPIGPAWRLETALCVCAGVCVCVCVLRGPTSTECAIKFTKSFLFKYAVITGNADRCSWVCMCFDSVDVLCTVTVSLLANYHGKLMGQVTAGSLKETGD